MKFLKKRPAPKLDNKLIVTRVRGGYIIEIDGLTTTNLKYYKHETLIAKSLNEILLVIKDWATAPEEIDDGRTQ